VSCSVKDNSEDSLRGYVYWLLYKGHGVGKIARRISIVQHV
jgi:hypothetical protein